MRLHEILGFSDFSASNSNVSNISRTPFPEKVTFSREKVTFSPERMTFTILKVTFRKLKLTFTLGASRTLIERFVRTQAVVWSSHRSTFYPSRRDAEYAELCAEWLFLPTQRHGVSQGSSSRTSHSWSTQSVKPGKTPKTPCCRNHYITLRNILRTLRLCVRIKNICVKQIPLCVSPCD